MDMKGCFIKVVLGCYVAFNPYKEELGIFSCKRDAVIAIYQYLEEAI
tara:strand:+ start:132 stop:272 length:141 start_codon:yes stop_codon:yes gene_type:complete